MSPLFRVQGQLLADLADGVGGDLVLRHCYSVLRPATDFRS
jgi:hypothetical protein